MAEFVTCGNAIIAEQLERERVDPREYDKELLRKIGVKSYQTKEEPCLGSPGN